MPRPMHRSGIDVWPYICTPILIFLSNFYDTALPRTRPMPRSTQHGCARIRRQQKRCVLSTAQERGFKMHGVCRIELH